MHRERVASFDPLQAELLGEGGEAQIYALDGAHIVRLLGMGLRLRMLPHELRYWLK